MFFMLMEGDLEGLEVVVLVLGIDVGKISLVYTSRSGRKMVSFDVGVGRGFFIYYIGVFKSVNNVFFFFWGY